jgi:4-amino-4-deoxy-L-arabinose transferase-like glycosyltransferase
MGGNRTGEVERPGTTARSGRARGGWVAAPLLAAALLALLARLPGLWWGDDFPGGFHGHHVDEWTHVVNAEVLIDPKSPPRWHPNPYPKGLAAHVAVPVLVKQKLGGRDFGSAAESRARVVPPDRTLILFGRAWSVLYGVLTVVVLWFFARRLTGSRTIADLAAFLLALGGLHVSQSHFFVADVPALFWTLLATHLMLVDLDARGEKPFALPLAALATGVAAGLKLAVAGIPVLVLVALLQPKRLLRLAQAAAFFTCGVVGVNFGSYTPVDLQKTLAAGIASAARYEIPDLLRLYGLELLASLGAPVLLLAALGLGAALRAAFAPGAGPRRLHVAVLVLVPLAIQGLAMLRKLDPFPRHLLPFFPWLVLLAAFALRLLLARLGARRGVTAAVLAAVFLWQAALVADGERNYLTEPRNAAMRWIESVSDLPKGAAVTWPSFEKELAARGFDPTKTVEQGRPDVIVAELYSWNHFLSGAGLRESYPRDWRDVFDAKSQTDASSQQRLDAHQAVFRGTAGYREAARFDEGYWMPELRLADRVLGNRSRNYLTGIVIFRRD